MLYQVTKKHNFLPEVRQILFCVVWMFEWCVCVVYKLSFSRLLARHSPLISGFTGPSIPCGQSLQKAPTFFIRYERATEFSAYFLASKCNLVVWCDRIQVMFFFVKTECENITAETLKAIQVSKGCKPLKPVWLFSFVKQRHFLNTYSYGDVSYFIPIVFCCVWITQCLWQIYFGVSYPCNSAFPFFFKATKDPYYLEAGRTILENLNRFARVPCGFAAMKDVRTGSHEDR